MKTFLLVAFLLGCALAAPPAKGETKEEKERVERGKGKGGRGHRGSFAFLNGLKEDQTKEFYSIMRNADINKTVRLTQVKAWADKNGVKDQVNELEAKLDKRVQENNKNVTEAIAKLPEAFKQVNDIFEDATLTPKQAMEKFRAMMDTYSPQLRRLVDATAPFHRGGRRGHGHPHHFAKGQGDNKADDKTDGENEEDEAIEEGDVADKADN